MAGASTAELSHTDGVAIVGLARDAASRFVRYGQRLEPGSMPDAFYRRTGAIVRIVSSRGGTLRGCAGDVEGSDQLGHAVVDAAIEAASAESCGSELGASELRTVRISVCPIEWHGPLESPLETLELGRHGVAVAGETGAGWLHPRLPIENGWTAEVFLERCCRTAGLAPDAWRDDAVSVTAFAGPVFQEREPGGAVERL